jgi:O-antigen ligase
MQRINLIFKQGDFVEWAAVFFSLSFCLGLGINTIAYILFLGVGIIFSIRDRFQKKPVNLKNSGLFLIGVFIIIAVREVIANDDVIKILAKYLPFILLPLVVVLQSERLKNRIPIILKAFLIGCLLNAIVNLGFAFYRGVIINPNGINFWYFTYDFLAEPFRIQPIYLAMFYVFSLFILNHFEYARTSQWFYYTTLFILTISIFLLSARNAIACLLILFPTYLYINGKLSVKKASILVGILVVCFLMAIQNPVVKNRIFKAHKEGNLYSGSSLRWGVWESAYNVSKENFVWGSGKSKAEAYLLEEYKKRNLLIPIENNYNSHNQYLQFLIQYGALGLFFFLLIIILFSIKLIMIKNYLGFFWVLLFSISAITESVLMRQWGIFSFTFFTSLLLYKRNETASRVE